MPTETQSAAQPSKHRLFRGAFRHAPHSGLQAVLSFPAGLIAVVNLVLVGSGNSTQFSLEMRALSHLKSFR